MNKSLEIVAIIMALLFAVPAISSGGQFKITEVYDGTTMRAEGYDIDCLP
jgi:hypothetical protein